MNCKVVQACSLSELECSVGYKFKNIDFLNEALRHSSFVNEQPKNLKDNEKLEFLGDAVLNFVVSDILIRKYSKLNEGDLSKMRASLVNERQLAIVARSVDLGSYLYLGKGELLNNGRNKNSVLANALEAVIAAVYLDGGISSSIMFIKKLFYRHLKQSETISAAVDYKSTLQEKAQRLYYEVPRYKVVSEYGPEHAKVFKIRMDIGNITSHGKGRNKKEAEQLAACNGLELLKGKN